MKHLAPWCGLLVAACAGGTETGNPPGAVEVSLALSTSDGAVASADPGQGGVWVQAAWVSLGEVALLPCAPDGMPLSVLDAPRAVELTRDSATLEPDAAVDEPHCGARLVLAPATDPPGDAPASLAENSVVLAGELADGTPFELVSSATPTLALHPPAGVEALEGAEALLLWFDLAAWFGAVDLSTATPSGDGSVRVDHVDNAELLTTFDSHFEQAVSLHADRDGDGSLDEDEQAALARPP